ncbi:RICIN domain-containing protein [Herpetosiphon giganteus]|uniref:RICIN domain-containing protein n=1 Tax=Herpetosiphon giganteus TaxID=2029754 RepID=UPI00195A6034|nr:RICIN domain-containing protein [Herpetosiphon giganteus]MBM7842868.1 hypothetical protein [Herpetosiphon giganteus]
MKAPRLIWIFALLVLFGSSLPSTQAQTRNDREVEPAKDTVPVNDPERGMIYDGLTPAKTGPCAGMYEVKVGDQIFCSHGPDPIAKGKSVKDETLPLDKAAINPKIVCNGDGHAGNRTQVMYVRASDRPDRFNQFVGSIRQWSSDMDRIYQTSAQETGGFRAVNFVTNNCEIYVMNVVVPADGDDSIDKTANALKALGHNRADRKYLTFVDNNILCGVAFYMLDDRPDQNNANNFGPGFARMDNGCWNGSTAAHEHMHTMGAVQRSAPNSTAYGHCIDDEDIMCYVDGPGTPPMQNRCGASQYGRFDCNHDDYFHTNPPAGSYLATKWNSANNKFLLKQAPGTTYYRLRNKATNKCIDVAESGNPANGTPILQWDCHTGHNQQWQLISTDNGFVRFVSRATGKVMDVSTASTNDGAKIHQWEWVGGANQQWKINDLGNGYGTITARHSGLAVDIPWCDSASGVQLQQVNPTNNDCQSFAFEPMQ